MTHYYVRTAKNTWGQSDGELKEALHNARLREYTPLGEDCAYVEQLHNETDGRDPAALERAMKTLLEEAQQNVDDFTPPEPVDFQLYIMPVGPWKFSGVDPVDGHPLYVWTEGEQPVDVRPAPVVVSLTFTSDARIIYRKR